MVSPAQHSSTRTEPTISYPFVTALCDAVGDDDIVRDGLRRFDLAQLADETTRVPLRRYIGLFEWLASELKRPYLGLELSQRTGPETLGAISYLFLGSRNLEMALWNFSHYLQAVQDDSRLRLGIDGEYALMQYGILDHRITNRRQDSEYSIGYCWRLMQIFSANACRLTMVEFEHERPPGGEGPYRRVFGAPVLFRRRANALHFRREHLETPSRSGDPHLIPILEAHMRELVAEAERIESFADQVRASLTQHALGQGMRAKEIAGQLGISEATLHRRRAAEGTSFKRQSDEAAKSLASYLIAQRTLSIAAIARRLGYAETACLTRAFRRWFGMSPRQYRRALDERT